MTLSDTTPPRRRAVLVAVHLAGVEDDDIAAELARDDTAAGARHADYARAARPDAAVKERAWKQVTTDLSLSNHASAAMAAGFWQLDQVELCAGYVGRYFAAVCGVWEARSPQVAHNLATRLYPSVVVEQSVLDRAAVFLAAEDLPASLRRVVVEQTDHLRRAVAARAREAAA